LIIEFCLVIVSCILVIRKIPSLLRLGIFLSTSYNSSRHCEHVIIRGNPEHCSALDRHEFSSTKILAMTECIPRYELYKLYNFITL